MRPPTRVSCSSAAAAGAAIGPFAAWPGRPVRGRSGHPIGQQEPIAPNRCRRPPIPGPVAVELVEGGRRSPLSRYGRVALTYALTRVIRINLMITRQIIARSFYRLNASSIAHNPAPAAV